MGFFRRLLVGLLKGLVLGGLVGAGVHLGLGWTRTSGVLAYLIAVGAGATVGLLAGKPPWARGAWLESVLRAVGGLVVGGLLYFLAVRFASAPIPLEAGPGVPAGTPWVELPLLYALAVGALYGALVELDHTPDRPGGGARKASKGRAAPDGGGAGGSGAPPSAGSSPAA